MVKSVLTTKPNKPGDFCTSADVICFRSAICCRSVMAGLSREPAEGWLEVLLRRFFEEPGLSRSRKEERPLKKDIQLQEGKWLFRKLGIFNSERTHATYYTDTCSPSVKARRCLVAVSKYPCIESCASFTDLLRKRESQINPYTVYVYAEQEAL